MDFTKMLAKAKLKYAIILLSVLNVTPGANAQNYCRSAVEVTKKSSEIENSKVKLNSQAAGQLINEFIDNGAILGSLQFACILTAAEINPQSDVMSPTADANRVESLTSAVRNNPQSQRTEALGNGYQGFNSAESQLAKEQNLISLSVLENLLSKLEEPKKDRDFLFKNMKERLAYSSSTNSLAKTLKYIADLKRNNPVKYQSFLEAWEASAPDAAKIALRLRGSLDDKSSQFKGSIKDVFLMMATALAVATGVGLHYDLHWSMIAVFEIPFIPTSFIFSALISENYSPINYTTAKVRGLGGLIKRAIIKRQVKRIAQQKLSISEFELQKMMAGENSAEAKSLAHVQALEQLDLTQLINENGVQQLSNLDNNMDVLKLRQIRIMSRISGELAILSERFSIVNKEFEALVLKQKNLVQSDDQGKRVFLAKLDELQGIIFQLKLDAQKLLNTQQDYLGQMQDLLSNLGNQTKDEDKRNLNEQIQIQISIQQGAEQGLELILQKSREQISGLTNLSLALIAKQVTNTVRAH
jgi:hypothetical protein